MNHFKLSLFKSILRIITCIAAFILAFFNIIAAVCMLAGGLATAEFIGILEEIFDKRKE